MIGNYINSSNIFIVIFCFLNLNNCYASSNDIPKRTMTQSKESTIRFSEFEKQIAAKMALDIRYFCPEQTNTQVDNLSLIHI